MNDFVRVKSGALVTVATLLMGCGDFDRGAFEEPAAVGVSRSALSTTANQSLLITNTAVAEGNGGTTSANFTVFLNPASGQQVTVDFATADGSATTADGDYQATSGTATFPPGSTSQPVSVPVNGDIKFEGNEIQITYTGQITSDDEIKFTRKVADFATEELVAKRVK